MHFIKDYFFKFFSVFAFIPVVLGFVIGFVHIALEVLIGFILLGVLFYNYGFWVVIFGALAIGIYILIFRLIERIPLVGSLIEYLVFNLILYLLVSYGYQFWYEPFKWLSPWWWWVLIAQAIMSIIALIGIASLPE
jgi:hypothetical protein